MPSHRYPIVAREGWMVLLVLAVVALVVAYKLGALVSIPLWCLLALFMFLYRDPYRRVPSSPLAVVAPVGGVISEIQTVDDCWLGREGTRLRLQMDYHTSYSIRSPIEGKVTRTWCSEPEGMHTEDKLNKRQTFCITSDEDDQVVMSICVNKLGSRLRCYAHPGERVGQGQRCGYFFLGGVVEVILPATVRLAVKEGDRVLSGSSILGQLSSQPREQLEGMTRPLLT